MSSLAVRQRRRSSTALDQTDAAPKAVSQNRLIHRRVIPDSSCNARVVVARTTPKASAKQPAKKATAAKVGKGSDAESDDVPTPTLGRTDSDADDEEKKDKKEKPKEDSDNSSDAGNDSSGDDSESSDDKEDEEDGDGSDGDNSSGSQEGNADNCIDCIQPILPSQPRCNKRKAHKACSLAVRAAVHALRNRPTLLKKFKKLKIDDPRAYAKGILKMVKKSPGVGASDRSRRGTMPAAELVKCIEEVVRIKSMTRDTGAQLLCRRVWCSKQMKRRGWSKEKAKKMWIKGLKTEYTEQEDGQTVMSLKKPTELNAKDGIEIRKVKKGPITSATLKEFGADLKGFSFGSGSASALGDMLGGGADADSEDHETIEGDNDEDDDGDDASSTSPSEKRRKRHKRDKDTRAPKGDKGAHPHN